MTQRITRGQEGVNAEIQWLNVTQPAIPLAQTASRSWVPELSVISALGLFSMALADTGARGGVTWAEPLFWVSLFLLVVPITARLITVQASRHERITLVLMLGLAFYLVKIFHSPVAFTFGDEFFHQYNEEQTLQTNSLFNVNPLLPASSRYPGLQTATSALASLIGLPVFESGLVIIGAARLLLLLALFFFHERVSGSSRVAGIAAVLYMANPNFVFWGAQFAYESLALPLAVFAIYVVAQRQAMPVGTRTTRLTLIALFGLAAVVITHHLTSYALVAFLWAVSIAYRWFASNPRGQPAPWHLAITASAATLVWTAMFAVITIGYLSPVFGSALGSLVRTLANESSSRELFRSAQGVVAPLWDRVIGIISILLIALGLPFGMRQFWQKHRNPFNAVLAVAAIGYMGMLLLRLAPGAWETANRSSEFLYVGLSFIVALAVVEVWKPERAGQRGYLLSAVYVAVIVAGGVIAGWNPDLRLPKPYEVETSAGPVEPQGVSAAQWVLSALGPSHRIAADQSNARLMLSIGNQYPHSGEIYELGQLFAAKKIGDQELSTLQFKHVEYVLVDRRRVSWDNMLGFYFDRVPQGSSTSTGLLAPEVYKKFDNLPSVSRIYDSGNITIYDVRRLSGVASSTP